jgi:hypothetical protein
MVTHYHASERLRNLRISRRCYTLLNNARIAPRNLDTFYRTYRLPANAFFPLFFEVKRDYLAERERRQEERRQYILAATRSLPPDILRMVKYLGHLERFYNGAGASPVWQRELFPRSKKQADAYLRYTNAEWHAVFGRHVESLAQTYGGLTEVVAERVLACFALGIVPEDLPPSRPAAIEITRIYRRLSLQTHPDRGGDPAMFIRIKRARDVLVNRS